MARKRPRRVTHQIEKKLAGLGHELPSPPQPVASYVGFVRVGNLLFVSGNTGRLNGQPRKYSGKVGDAVSLTQAYEMARNCALNHLAAIKQALGSLDRVERIVRVNGYVNAARGFNDLAQVLNGESDLLVQLWGERGGHARTTVGVASLGGEAPVETEIIVQVKR